MCPEVEKYIKVYEQFATVVLLDELCCLSNAAIMKFRLETCFRADAIKYIILSRTGDRSGNDN